ncbi:thiamine pyrophosphate enzyme, N-terminal TPP binding domain-containing protein [Phaeosphaeriaceae sp. PMI808]|nr:thiamine pyrophosphate enzyme, N-terminal TPP binding domain-containing protein [Phaeosphaeriaceae sp. PMI808]
MRLDVRTLQLGRRRIPRLISTTTTGHRVLHYGCSKDASNSLPRFVSASRHYTRKQYSEYATKQKRNSSPECYTTAFAIFEGLWETGVTRCFVNVGSDHPSILEAFIKGKRERPHAFPQMITCPSEVTAISIADGYARISGKPQAVLVHVDVGTQALGQGVHNASIARVPVFILAGLCPFTESDEMIGSKTEYSNWLQDAHDQAAIVRQYCRYVGEVRTGLNVKQLIGRALQFAKTAPKGPVYLAAAREVLAQETEPMSLEQDQWVPIGPSALPADAVQEIAAALVGAERPLIITGYSGRDRRTPELLVALADLIPGIRIHDTGGSDMCFPVSHPASEGFRLSTDKCTQDADVIFLLDCDIPWIPSKNRPPKSTKIYHVDIDPLNQQIRVSFFPAHGRWRADGFTALTQLVDFIKGDQKSIAILQNPIYIARGRKQAQAHKARFAIIQAQTQGCLDDSEKLNGNNVGSLLRAKLPEPTTFVVEAVTNSQIMHDQLQPSRPGGWINCGATGIGWSNGAALGVRMALQDQEVDAIAKRAIVCQIVGDGSFMCAAPSSALWVASKYEIPILTIVLNNGGWKAPRNSVEMVYPDGANKYATEDELNISFRPSPNYAALAEAAVGSQKGWMKAVQVHTVGGLKRALQQAVIRVGDEQKAMFIEVLM